MLLPVVVIFHFAPDHTRHERFFIDVFQRKRIDFAAVAQDGYAVGDFKQLFQAVRYIYDRDIVFLQNPYLLKQRVDFVFGKR